jgi:septal ring factor EnvC (AmiA/AmiB activator)
VADGRVAYRGHVRGLGRAVLVRHDGFWSLSGPLAEGPAVAEGGAVVERGAVLGESAADTVYLEIRLATGDAGVPVDPVPLIAR